MLINDFYTIIDIKSSASSHAIQVRLNADHKIYEGHFPNQPVVPGVCTMQLVKECVEKIKNVTLCYSQVQTCKFLSVINPKVDNIIEIAITLSDGEGSDIAMQADILQKEQQVTKLKATLKAM